jgi:hypothetical protein
MTDLDQLAAKLTDAQRAAILNAKPAVSATTFWYGRTRSIAALHRKGLADYPQAPARLTGLAVVLRSKLSERDEG